MKFAWWINYGNRSTCGGHGLLRGIENNGQVVLVTKESCQKVSAEKEEKIPWNSVVLINSWVDIEAGHRERERERATSEVSVSNQNTVIKAIHFIIIIVIIIEYNLFRCPPPPLPAHHPTNRVDSLSFTSTRPGVQHSTKQTLFNSECNWTEHGERNRTV